MTDSIKPNFAVVAARGKVREAEEIINDQNRTDVTIASVKDKFDTLFMHAPDDFAADLKAARHDAIKDVEALGAKGIIHKMC